MTIFDGAYRLGDPKIVLFLRIRLIIMVIMVLVFQVPTIQFAITIAPRVTRMEFGFIAQITVHWPILSSRTIITKVFFSDIPLILLLSTVLLWIMEIIAFTLRTRSLVKSVIPRFQWAGWGFSCGKIQEIILLNCPAFLMFHYGH